MSLFSTRRSDRFATNAQASAINPAVIDLMKTACSGVTPDWIITLVVEALRPNNIAALAA